MGFVKFSSLVNVAINNSDIEEASEQYYGAKQRLIDFADYRLRSLYVNKKLIKDASMFYFLFTSTVFKA